MYVFAKLYIHILICRFTDVLPAQLQQSTRKGRWKTIVIWGVAHEEVKSLIPMSLQTLKAITQEILMVGCSAGTI